MRIRLTKKLIANNNNRIVRFIIAAIFVFQISNIYSQNSVNLVISPSSSTVQVNQVFTVDVLVDFGTGSVAGVDAYVDFNPTYLEVSSTPTVPAQTQTDLPNVSVPITFNNSTGTVDHGRFTISPSGHPSSDFVLLSIPFRVKAVPPGNTTIISFHTAFPRETAAGELSQPDALDQTINATITINPLGCTTPPTATIANTGTCNGQAFDLILSNATGATDWNLIINGTTYNDISVGETITTITPPTQNIWPNTAPAGVVENNGASLEVGIKFRSDVNGLVKGVRFYRPTAAGTFTGRLYLKTGAFTGTQLAVVTFPAAAANQWQTALFSSPVQISANTTYVVTYHSSSGIYISTANYFNNVTNPGVVNGHLTALAEGVDGNNGIYLDNGASGIPGGSYPVASYQSSNYWVDPVFTPGEFSYQLTSVTDNDGCVNIGSPLQTLNVTSPACSPLPVTLLNLSATPQGKNVVLNWTTSSEINNKGFEIQRSSDNILWEGLSFVNGAGTSTIPHSYTYTDNDLFPQRYYYRLKQVDNDANFKFSMTVTVLLSGKGEYSLKQNYPNPFNNETSIQYTLPETQKVKLTVFDIHGRTVKVLVNETRQPGTHAVNFYTSKLQPGLYYYKLEAGSFSTVKKMVIQ